MSAVAAVIGAGQGIGAACARALASDHLVLAGGRRQALLDDVADLIRSRGGAAVAHSVDVTDDASVADYFARAAELGPLRLVVVSAGIGQLGPMARTTPAAFDEMLKVNAGGSYRALHHAAPQLKATRGMFVAIGSRAGSQVFPDAIAYGASKAALAYSVRAVSRELAADGVRVVCLSPGGVATPMRAAAFPDEDPTRIMQPDEIGALVVEISRLSGPNLAGVVLEYPW